MEILDIDYFKQYNDNYGHSEGDKCIKTVAEIINKQRDYGKVFTARFGGDEFILIDTGRDEALPDRLQASVKEYNRTSGMPFKLGLSLGVIKSDAAERRPIDDCIKAADSLMYEIKEQKKAGRR